MPASTASRSMPVPASSARATVRQLCASMASVNLFCKTTAAPSAAQTTQNSDTKIRQRRNRRTMLWGRRWLASGMGQSSASLLSL